MFSAPREMTFSEITGRISIFKFNFSLKHESEECLSGNTCLSIGTSVRVLRIILSTILII